jgi:RNA ligase (TIGR02306 family)
MSSESRIIATPIVKVEPHPNADRLDVVTVWSYPVITSRGEYRAGDIVAYVPVDLMLPVADPRFAFLDLRGTNGHGLHRVRAIKLRGTYSMGMVFPAPGAQDGDDLTDAFGAVKYDPPTHSEGVVNTDDEHDLGYMPTYTDIESIRKWGDGAFGLDEEVVCTEKVHGANGRWCWADGRLWCGSRTRIKKQDPRSLWWRVAESHGLAELLALVPETVVFGEVYGPVQDLKYGCAEPGLVVFDVWKRGAGYLDYDEMFRALPSGLPMAPVLYRGPFRDIPADLAEGSTVVGSGAHVREGYVVRPVKERWSPQLGRVILKHVGQGYHLRKAA